MPYAKMAKNYETLVFHPNTIQQNKNILHEFRSKSQAQGRSKEDLNKLFTKLNHKCRLNYAREEKHASSAWYSQNVIGCTYGPITGLPPGSWWGIRMDCSRDHVHGPFNEDVQNGPFGVTSICTPNNTISEDVDLGDILTFTGEEYQDNPERDPLVMNYKNQIPVRLVRSYDRLNEYAPKTGYRYDGMYTVANFWIGVNSNGMKCFKFILTRLNNQESAPWKNDRSSTVSKKPLPAAYAVRKPPFKDCSELTTRGSYEFRKYSHRSNETLKLINFDHTNDLGKFIDVENRGAIMKQKPVSESAIVTRHVFKKSNVNTDSAITPSTSSHMDGKSILQIGNSISKAHSTNISIRTGLYDSSQTVQHDTKKSSTMPFSRAPKTMNILKTSQHIENFNLSKRDKTTSDVKADGLKSVNRFTQVDSQQNKFNNLLAVTNNVSSSPSSNKSKKELIHYNPNKITEGTELVAAKSHTNGHLEVDYAASHHTQNLQNNKTHNEAMIEIEEQSTNKLNAEALKDASKLEKLPQAMEVCNGTENPESTTKTDYSTALQGLKAFISLDALTPDKILQLISKEKTNPLSKLLIGNMIGLSAEQSAALKTGEVLEKAAATQKSDIKETGRKKNHKATSEDLMATRCYKFRRRKMRRRILNKPDMGKSDKVLRSRLQKDLSKSFDVLGEHHVLPQTDTQSTDRVKTKIRKRKNIGNRVIGVKSTVRKYARRKKRREIKNLLIDAKVSPKVRGPRNRRLRCMNSVYTESICGSYRSINRTRSSSKPTSEVSGKQADFRDKGRLRKMKVHKRMTNEEIGDVSRRSKPARAIVASVEKQYGKAVDKDPTPKKSSNDQISSLRNNERLRTRRSIIEGVAPKLSIRRKRKFVQTEPQEVSCSPIKAQPENDHQKKAKKNAITQCSLISGELIEEASYLRNCEEERCDDIGFVDEELYIKQEPEDAADCKSEICDSVQPENENVDDYENYQSYEFCRYTESSRPSSKNTVLSRYRGSVSSGAEEQRALSTERVSAFVPVNTMDTHERIIRLRSIGFKPIPCQLPVDEEETDSAGSSTATCSRKVVKQDVTEKYDKYANGENNVVVYMDEELQYQDIEDEDKVSLPKRYKMAAACNDFRKPLLMNPQESDTSREGSILEQLSNNSRIEKDLEAPWHGWKKVETDDRSYWIGW